MFVAAPIAVSCSTNTGSESDRVPSVTVSCDPTCLRRETSQSVHGHLQAGIEAPSRQRRAFPEPFPGAPGVFLSGAVRETLRYLSFRVFLAEMLTGRSLFQAKTST